MSEDNNQTHGRVGREGRPRRTHANRGGAGRDGSNGKVRHDRSNPYRQGFREDRMAQKENEPALPDDIDAVSYTHLRAHET